MIDRRVFMRQVGMLAAGAALVESIPLLVESIPLPAEGSFTEMERELLPLWSEYATKVPASSLSATYTRMQHGGVLDEGSFEHGGVRVIESPYLSGEQAITDRRSAVEFSAFQSWRELESQA